MDKHRCPYCDKPLNEQERYLGHACGQMQDRRACERVLAEEQRKGLAQRRR